MTKKTIGEIMTRKLETIITSSSAQEGSKEDERQECKLITSN